MSLNSCFAISCTLLPSLTAMSDGYFLQLGNVNYQYVSFRIVYRESGKSLQTSRITSEIWKGESGPRDLRVLIQNMVM